MPTPTGRLGIWLDSPMIEDLAGEGTVKREFPGKYNAEVEAAGITGGRVAPAIIPDYTEPEVRERQLTAKELSASLTLSRR